MSIIASIFPSWLRALLLASAFLKQQEAIGQDRPLRGIRDLPHFNNINVAIGNAEIIIEKGDKFSVTTEPAEALDRYVRCTVKNNELRIDAGKKKMPVAIPIKVRVALPGFYYILNTGTAVVRSEDLFDENEMKIENAGSGRISLVVHPKAVTVISSGAGGVILTGKVEELNCTLSGSGLINAINLEAKTVHVNISGSGQCDLFCNHSLTGSITGAGNVRYNGQPTNVKVDISGSGKMQRQ